MFLCVDERLKHFLADCAKFKRLSIADKRKKIIEAGKYLNCLSVGHFVRNCELHSKCHKCGPKYKNKHSGVLHEFYSRSTSINLGAAKSVSTKKSNKGETSTENVVVWKMVPNNNNLVLLRTSAVKVINPSSGRCALVYAQHDTASQVTLISEELSNELGLKIKDSNAITIRTLAEETTPASGVVQFNLESLTTKEIFAVNDAIVVPGFMDDERVLPHKINTANLKQFKGVKIPTIPEMNFVDILIGQPQIFTHRFGRKRRSTPRRTKLRPN